VTSIQGYTGNCGAGDGFLNIAASLLSLDSSGQIPHSLNTRGVDSSLGINVVTGRPLATDNKLFVAANYTRCGQAAAVVVEGA